MSEQPTSKSQLSVLNQRLEVQIGWQAWNTATADWTAQLQHLQTFNFVFRTVWDPETRASWLLKLCAVRQAALYAQSAWTMWQAQVEADYQAQLARQTKASALARQEHWERSVAESGEAQVIWARVLQELAYAEAADEYFLPDDAQWLAARTYHHYKQILYATERARAVAEAAL